MSPWCVRGGAIAGRALWLATALCLLPFAVPAWAGTAIPVNIDRARLIQLPASAKTVVIGNPLIADLSIQPGGLAVITGKGYGATNVIVLDKDGAVLNEETILVTGPSDPTVVVYRGPTRQTYSCAPDCERRITLGDTGNEFFDGAVDKDYFGRTIGQTATRDSQASAEGANK